MEKKLKNLENVEHYEPMEKLVKIIERKTQNNDSLFFRVLVAYYFTKIASMMRTNIKTHDRGVIPVNMYAINLAPSGVGKGHSTNIVEDQIIAKFKERFLEETFPIISETSIAKLANKRAHKKNIDPDEELERVQKEFENLGNLAFSFDSGTTAAVKQMRHKLLMASAGSMNMEIDEIGSNLLGNVDVLTTFLELYDVGKVKQKLTKNTADNTRSEEIDGRTPTNMMLFGTPVKLFDGSKVEEAIMSFFDTGYARRCIFGYADKEKTDKTLTPNEIYDMLTDTTSDAYIHELADKLENLADIINFNTDIEMTKEVTLEMITYKLHCEERADVLGEHDEIRKAELNHRYFKALKLAGTFAFIDSSPVITEDHLYSSIKLVEESGKAFDKILTREPQYIKLAKYISTVNKEVTHVDIMEHLPLYRIPETRKRELLNLAIAYGYKNNIIIKKYFSDGIEFLRGETLTTTDLDKLTISYSTQLAEGYLNDSVKFDDMHKLVELDNYHWASHHFIDGHRKEDNCIPGFDTVVLDIDDSVTINTVKLLLNKYKYLLYTTKRHTEENQRFRLVLPISHKLKMDSSTFKEFMNNIYEWLPFDVDTQTNQRSRKWLSNKGHHYYNDGELLDALIFIPKTTKNEERKKLVLDQNNLSNLERWFINNTGDGNRSNQLIKYALLLVDSGMDLDSVKNNTLALNSKLPDMLEESEVISTILVSASKAIAKREV